jgi:multiple sugar transport system ATP-binding protein
MNLLPARVKTASESGVIIALPGAGDLELPVRSNNLKPDEPVTLGVRPEHLHLSQQGEFHGEVIIAERLGSETYLYVQTDDGKRVTIETRGDSTARIHDRVGVQVDGRNCHLFNSSGEAI